MKLIDKDTVVAEIERRIKSANNDVNIGAIESLIISKTLNGFKSFIDTLEVKEVDLDNFIKEEFNKYSCVDGYGQLSVSYNMAEFYGMIKRLTKAQKGEEV